ncbi:MAG: nicotinic acid mononucleotide adenylyltransferase, partial [Candidatus Sedimenticola endophacoides]
RPGGCILFQPVTQMAISSSAIRTLIRRGESPRFLLPDPVLTIIRRQNLYGGD